MYTAYVLTDKSRKEILEKFPPAYEKIIAHHITLKYGTSQQEPAPLMPHLVRIIGYINSNDGVEGLLVDVDGTTIRPDGNKFHITLSISNNRKPVETNNYTSITQPIEPMIIEVIPRNCL